VRKGKAFSSIYLCCLYSLLLVLVTTLLIEVWSFLRKVFGKLKKESRVEFRKPETAGDISSREFNIGN